MIYTILKIVVCPYNTKLGLMRPVMQVAFLAVILNAHQILNCQ